MIDEDRVRTAAGAFREWASANRTLHVLGLVVLLVVVSPFVVHAVPQFVGADQSYVVTSGSMEPAISPGDVILVGQVAPAQIQPGDVITYERASSDQPTTHRVVEVLTRDGERVFETKGDANEDADARLVGASQVRGRVPTVGGHRFVIPFIGYVIEFANTPMGFFALVVVPVGLLVASELWNVIASTRGSESGARGGPPRGTDETSPAEAGAEEAVLTGSASNVPTASATAAAPATRSRNSRGGNTASPGGGQSDETTVTVRPAELRLASVVAGAFAAYSLWVAFDGPGPWTVGIAGSAVVGFALLAGLHRYGGSATAEPQTAATAEDGAETTARQGTYTIRPTELRLGVAVLGVFVADAAWVAAVRTTVWSVTVGAVTVATFCLLCGLYVFGGTQQESGTGAVDDDGAGDGGTGDGGEGAAAGDGATSQESVGTHGGDDLVAADGDDGVSSPDPRPGDGRPTGGPVRRPPVPTGPGPGPTVGADDVGGKRDVDDADGVGGKRDVVIRSGRPSPTSMEKPHQPVGSLTTLVEMAETTGRQIYRDPVEGTHYLPGEGVLYVCAGTVAGPRAAGTDAGESVTEETGDEPATETGDGKTGEADAVPSAERSHETDRTAKTDSPLDFAPDDEGVTASESGEADRRLEPARQSEDGDPTLDETNGGASDD